MKPKIIILDFNFPPNHKVKRILTDSGFDVHHEYKTVRKFESLKTHFFNLCIIDNDSFNHKSIAIIKKIKECNIKTPVFFLSSNAIKSDVILTYKAGIDDYIIKPIDNEILVIKIKNALKNKLNFYNHKLDFNIGKYHLNSTLRELIFDDKIISLTPKEFQLLKLLILNVNDFLSKETALNLIWNKEDYFSSKSMDVYISRLRKHLLYDKNISIDNIRDSGYRLLIK